MTTPPIYLTLIDPNHMAADIIKVRLELIFAFVYKESYTIKFIWRGTCKYYNL